jgi:spermidine/putrescine ABC transporter ATP-binding subunit
MLVRFSNVTKSYGCFKAIDDVTITVNSGELTTILGPSGSGKSTMLSLISGISVPTSGRIEIGNREITFVAAAQRNIGLVFQSYALFPHMTIFDNVAFPLRVRGVRAAELKDRVADALRMVRLGDFGQRKPHQLSGGQQQRVALARAIVFRPDILLLDEPLAALDRKLREEVRSEIRDLQRRLGITTIMVTHDQEEALSMSDHIVLLAGGKVEQIGAPDEIYYRPKTRFTAGFLGSANFFEGCLRTRSEIVSDDGGVFPCNAPADRTTERVCGMLRPEDIHADDEKGFICGTIKDVVFLGESVRYSVELERGCRITASMAGSRRPKPEGSKVWLFWDPARVWILPEGTGGAPGR